MVSTPAIIQSSFVRSAARAGSRSRLFATSTTISGKPRFYRNVSIMPASPPWSSLLLSSSSTPPTTPDVQDVPSPISAGVDGTDSASGVVASHNRRSNKRTLQYYRDWLNPREPGQPGKSELEYEWFAVCLDGRPLQTPVKSRLVVPSQFLAQMIAAEWNAQSTTLVPAQMPLTTLACTILDQVSEQPSVYQSSVLQYLPTDTLLFWADPTVDEDLYREQQARWTPILDYLQSKLGHAFPVSCADASVVVKTRKSQMPPMDSSLRELCQNWVESLDAWHLGILYALTVEAKSLGMGLAYLYESSVSTSSLSSSTEASSLEWKRLTNFVPACRIEEEIQIANWGLVEGGHDYDRLNCSIQVHAAVVLQQCLELERLLRLQREGK